MIIFFYFHNYLKTYKMNYFGKLVRQIIERHKILLHMEPQINRHHV